MSKRVGKITGVKATGSMILVEMLGAQEITGSTLYINEKSDVGTPQGYILSIGPAVEVDKLGFKVGDRVIIQGKYVPVPGGHTRELGIVDIYSIKAVLEEKSVLESD